MWADCWVFSVVGAWETDWVLNDLIWGVCRADERVVDFWILGVIGIGRDGFTGEIGAFMMGADDFYREIGDFYMYSGVFVGIIGIMFWEIKVLGGVEGLSGGFGFGGFFYWVCSVS